MATLEDVIVVGATGNLGPSIVEALQDARKFNVSILTRSRSDYAQFEGKVPLIETDYSPASLENAFAGKDAVVSVVAGAALGEQKKLIDAAVAAGVKRFIPSEFGSNTANKEAQELVPVFTRKVEVKNYLEEKESEGLTWTGIIVGPIFDRSLEFGILGFDLKNHEAMIYDDGTRRFTTSTLRQVAAAVVGVLSNPTKTANVYAYVGSFTTSQNEILAEIEQATTRKWSVKNISSEGEVTSYKERVVGRRDSSAIRPLITAAMFHAQGGSDYESQVGLNNDDLGLRKESLQEVIQGILDRRGS